MEITLTITGATPAEVREALHQLYEGGTPGEPMPAQLIDALRDQIDDLIQVQEKCLNEPAPIKEAPVKEGTKQAPGRKGRKSVHPGYVIDSNLLQDIWPEPSKYRGQKADTLKMAKAKIGFNDDQVFYDANRQHWYVRKDCIEAKREKIYELMKL